MLKTQTRKRDKEKGIIKNTTISHKDGETETDTVS